MQAAPGGGDDLFVADEVGIHGFPLDDFHLNGVSLPAVHLRNDGRAVSETITTDHYRPRSLAGTRVP